MRDHVRARAQELGLRTPEFADPADLAAIIKKHLGESDNEYDVLRSLKYLMQYTQGLHLSIDIKFGNHAIWASEARVSVVFNLGDAADTFTGNVVISWSSSQRDVAHAMVAIDNYQKALSLAAKIEAFLSGRVLVDAKEPEPVAVAVGLAVS